MNGFIIRRSAELRSDQIVKSDDVTLKQQMQLIEGSRKLCRAILDTKKVYRKLTEREIDEAIEYAANVTIVKVYDE